jgi:peptidoglycan hydrolase FlgJ
MDIRSSLPSPLPFPPQRPAAEPPPALAAQPPAAERPGQMPSPQLPEEGLREAFNDFVGQTLFGQMLASMRSSQQKPAYLHGGRAEEIFQGQLDQLLTEELAKSSASSVADPMFELFLLQRSS